jgi:uncharacterized protein
MAREPLPITAHKMLSAPRLPGDILEWFCPASQVLHMFLSVKELELRKIGFDETFEAGQIDFASEELEQGSPLRVAGVAELLDDSGGEVRIQRKYSVEMTALCDRCLGRALFPLQAQFDLYYRPASQLAGEVEVEIDEGEAEIGFYEGKGLELMDILREQVMLALPMQRVCSEDCKGICPVCGRNRNETTCDCKVQNTDDRWAAALRNLER